MYTGINEQAEASLRHVERDQVYLVGFDDSER
jgi:hypothetical protein